MGARLRNNESEVVVVAVDASKEITDYALEWAVRNVIKAGDTLVLLALLPSSNQAANRNDPSGFHHFLSSLFRKWGLYEEKGSPTHAMSMNRAGQWEQRINEVCVQMIKQLCSANRIKQVETHVKMITDAQMGCVATKAGELGAAWVILDRRLKKEGEFCLKQLTCNIIVIDHAIPKTLRLINPQFQASEEFEHTIGLQGDKMEEDMPDIFPMYRSNSKSTTPTPQSSLGLDSQSANTDNSHSFSSIEREDAQKIPPAPFVASYHPSKSLLYRNSEPLGLEYKIAGVSKTNTSHAKSQELKKVSVFDEDDSIVDRDKVQFGTDRNNGVKQLEKPPKAPIPARRSADLPRQLKRLATPCHSDALVPGRRSLKDDRDRVGGKATTVSTVPPTSTPIDRTSSIRRAISISIKHPPKPPPLCSVCKHNAPIFGKPPRKFSYKEMDRATDGFSSANFLAEGGYGPVYKGVLPNGQVVGVKQHKSASAQGASEFCSEVEVLSCAQHRNLVMLVGYCMEKEWLLVYEFACNGSLDKHLYEKNSKEVMAWKNRMKVAIGAARGLRYLHEDCRVGCIVHRDLRPNNILLTHDFEPMVGDFGLARWQADGDEAEETRVVGTLGYLAPEYTRTGQITEKADVYAFGVLLMELISGLKAVDLSRSQGKQYLPEWGRPLLEKKLIFEMIDPRLEDNYDVEEVCRMMHAASLCIKPAPERRPRMSKVLRILEGEGVGDKVSQVQLQRAKTERAQPTPNSNTTRTMNMTSRSSSTNAGYNTEIQSSARMITNQNENLVSEEYQAYLQGSLAEFINRIKENSDNNEKTMEKSDEDDRARALYEDGYPITSPISKRSILGI